MVCFSSAVNRWTRPLGLTGPGEPPFLNGSLWLFLRFFNANWNGDSWSCHSAAAGENYAPPASCGAVDPEPAGMIVSMEDR
jgi:hypothetical protein